MADVAERVERLADDARDVTARVDDRVEARGPRRVEVAVAVAAQLLDGREELGPRLAAVEERHVVAAFERRVDDVAAEELGSAEDEDAHTPHPMHTLARYSIDDVGDPDGTPVVYLHGGGDSRLSRHPDDSIAAALGVRLLALDRCGPGGPRTLAARLGRGPRRGARVERFGVIGWSAGGPHALALAAVAPERVTRVALVGSMPPPDDVRELPRDVRRVMRLATFAPRIAARGLERWGRRPRRRPATR